MSSSGKPSQAKPWKAIKTCYSTHSGRLQNVPMKQVKRGPPGVVPETHQASTGGNQDISSKIHLSREQACRRPLVHSQLKNQPLRATGTMESPAQPRINTCPCWQQVGFAHGAYAFQLQQTPQDHCENRLSMPCSLEQPPDYKDAVPTTHAL